MNTSETTPAAGGGSSDDTVALFTGDSITDAGRRTDPSAHLGAGYVRRIAEMAAESGKRLYVTNTGVGGDRTSDLLDRFDADILKVRPNILTILIGINDMWRRYDSGASVSAAEFYSNYSRVLTRVRDELDLKRIVIMEPFLVPVKGAQLSWHVEDLDENIAITRELADRYGATLIPLNEIFVDRAARVGAASVIDHGVHPSAGGHELIAQLWWSSIGEEIPDRKGVEIDRLVPASRN